MTITSNDEVQKQEESPTEAREEQYPKEADAEWTEVVKEEQPAEIEVRGYPEVGVETEHHEPDRANEQEQQQQSEALLNPIEQSILDILDGQ